MSVVPYPQTRILYVFGVALVFLFLFGFLWVVMYNVFVPLQTSVLSSMSQYDVANTSYAAFEVADVFLTNLWTYFLILGVLALLYWVWVYSQRKNVQGRYY